MTNDGFCGIITLEGKNPSDIFMKGKNIMKKLFQKVSKFIKRFRLPILTIAIAIVGGICGFFFDSVLFGIDPVFAASTEALLLAMIYIALETKAPKLN